MDGGPTGNQYLMQFQSDILETTVSLPRCEESSALGAAFMAGLADGFYTMDVVIQKSNRKQYQPSMDETERTRRYLGWKDAVQKVLV